jgi:hypothetical protein
MKASRPSGQAVGDDEGSVTSLACSFDHYSQELLAVVRWFHDIVVSIYAGHCSNLHLQAVSQLNITLALQSWFAMCW